MSRYGSGSSIAIVDLAARAVTAAIDLPDGAGPHGLALLPDGLAWLACP